MYLHEKCRTKMNRFYNMWRWEMRFLVFFLLGVIFWDPIFASSCMGRQSKSTHPFWCPETCRWEPWNDTLHDEAKKTIQKRNWGPGSWPWSLCLAPEKDSLKRNSVEGSTFLRRKKKWNMLSLMLSLMCFVCFLRQTLPSTLSMPCLMRRGFLKTSKNSRSRTSSPNMTCTCHQGLALNWSRHRKASVWRIFWEFCWTCRDLMLKEDIGTGKPLAAGFPRAACGFPSSIGTRRRLGAGFPSFPRWTRVCLMGGDLAAPFVEDLAKALKDDDWCHWENGCV